MTPSARLVSLLRDPSEGLALSLAEWMNVLTVARAELLLASLAHRLDGLALPAAVMTVLDDARAEAREGRRIALWEANRVAHALTELNCPVILLKGTAFVAAGLAAGGDGRSAIATSCYPKPCSLKRRRYWYAAAGNG